MKLVLMFFLGAAAVNASAGEIYCMGTNIRINTTTKELRAPEFGIRNFTKAKITEEHASSSGSRINKVFTIQVRDLLITAQPNQSSGWGGPSNTHITVFHRNGTLRTEVHVCNID